MMIVREIAQIVSLSSSKLMTDSNDPAILRLKLLRLQRDKVKQAQIQARRSNAYIFTPKNDLEVAAIALAIQNENGWRGSLYSLDYFDRYLEDICFIFATKPEGSKNQEWLLVSFNYRTTAKYWIALGEKSLADVYYAWVRVVKKPDPSFDPERMANTSWEEFFPG